ncbi:MAG: hydroxyisourate hydrolase [Saccharospirillum sp.]|nr:hydroxyisourate hydrolase [Saccharospirillum sp.]
MSHTLSTHVLDTTLGQPARGMKLTLCSEDGSVLAMAETNQDGRFNDWPETAFPSGVYSLTFHTGDYLKEHHGKAFYPQATICFELSGSAAHYHIPLLISPFGYSTYRGS